MFDKSSLIRYGVFVLILKLDDPTFFLFYFFRLCRLFWALITIELDAHRVCMGTL